MSKWEDTVMTQGKKDSVLKLFLKVHPQYKGLNLWKPIARHQAEITWDIAFKAGTQEVVHWINNGNIIQDIGWAGGGEEWQAKLKDWGIEEEKDGTVR